MSTSSIAPKKERNEAYPNKCRQTDLTYNPPHTSLQATIGADGRVLATYQKVVRRIRRKEGGEDEKRGQGMAVLDIRKAANV
eukprot:9795222-Ditylum_brightwellii.AAC.1